MRRKYAIFGIVTLIALGSVSTAVSAQEGPSVSVSPDSGLSDGDTLEITATGFPAGSEEFLSGQCVTPIVNPLQQCDVQNIIPVPMDADGGATFEITIKTGAIGDGVCGEGEVQCVIMVGSLTQPEFGFAPIYFGSDGPEALAVTGPSSTLILTIIALAMIGAGVLMSVPRARLVWHRG